MVLFWGCVNNILPPAAAKYSLDRDVVFIIFHIKIKKKIYLEKNNIFSDFASQNQKKDVSVQI